MPTYDYRCLKCSHEFEEFQSMNAEPLKDCPKCDGEVERMIGGGAGLIFKGSGFYLTDYKNSSNANSGSESKNKKEDSKKSTPSTSSDD